MPVEREQNLSLAALQSLASAAQALLDLVNKIQGVSVIQNLSLSPFPVREGAVLLGELMNEFLLAKARSERSARTALEAGHTEAMLFAHYRELVTPEQAAEFWAIRPG